MTTACLSLVALVLAAGPPQAARAGKWVELFNGKTLDGWEVVGDGVWMVLRDGTVEGYLPPLQ